MEHEEALELQGKLIEEFVALILAARDGEDQRGTIQDVQPPSTVCVRAAEAAASVLMAFEIGYRMSGETE